MVHLFWILPALHHALIFDFVIEFLQAIDPGKFENKLDLSLKLNKILEEMIVRNPHQWIWTHNRWK